MKEYEVRVVETRSRIIEVYASSEEFAKRIVKDRYYEDEYTFTYADFDEVHFEVNEFINLK